MTALSADQLLEALRSGATLKSRWRRRATDWNRQRMDYRLTYPDGTAVNVQKSAVDALIHRRKITSIAWSGGARDYSLVEGE